MVPSCEFIMLTCFEAVLWYSSQMQMDPTRACRRLISKKLRAEADLQPIVSRLNYVCTTCTDVILPHWRALFSTTTTAVVVWTVAKQQSQRGLKFFAFSSG